MPFSRRLALGLLSGAVSGVIAVAPVHAQPLTYARFLHAVPGAAPAVLIVHGHPPRLPSAYGKPSPYHACHPGPARLELRVRGQKKAAVTERIDIGRGKYTVIAVPKGDGVGLRVYKDDGVVPGKARLRTINAAAELDRADMRVDGRSIARLHSGSATRYASIPPGRHSLSVTRPGGEGGSLASADDVPLVPGTASTAIVVGSRGMPTDILLVSDETAGPSAAPATGFLGDVGGDSDWLIVIVAALAAGSVGGGAYLASLRRRPAASVVAAPVRMRVPDVQREPPPKSPPWPNPFVSPASYRHRPLEPAPPGRAWAVGVGAVLTAGRLLYKAGRRRRA